MPNWVKNKVKFDKRFKEIVGSVINTGETENYLDFNKIKPMPESLNLIAGSNKDYAVLYAIMKMKGTSKFQDTIEKLKGMTECSYIVANYLIAFDKCNDIDTTTIETIEKEAEKFEKMLKSGERYPFDDVDYEKLGIHNFEDLGNVYINNVINYGYDTWYDWSIKNWGTKWNSRNTYVGDDYVEFETAWSCPVEVLMALSEKFSDVKIIVEYADEDIGSNCGGFILLNGKIHNHFEGDDDFALNLWNYDKDEWYIDK